MTAPPDIFDILPDWRGLSVLIIGNHPCAEDDLAAAPAVDIRIAVNAAVRHPHDLAMAFDLSCPDMPWWPLYEALDPDTLILGEELHRLTSLPCLATFRSRPVFTDTPTLARGLLRGGATISACALQFCLHARASSIHLAGIRLDGPYAYALPRFTALLALLHSA